MDNILNYLIFAEQEISKADLREKEKYSNLSTVEMLSKGDTQGVADIYHSFKREYERLCLILKSYNTGSVSQYIVYNDKPFDEVAFSTTINAILSYEKDISRWVDAVTSNSAIKLLFELECPNIVNFISLLKKRDEYLLTKNQ